MSIQTSSIIRSGMNPYSGSPIKKMTKSSYDILSKGNMYQTGNEILAFFNLPVKCKDISLATLFNDITITKKEEEFVALWSPDGHIYYVMEKTTIPMLDDESTLLEFRSNYESKCTIRIASAVANVLKNDGSIKSFSRVEDRILNLFLENLAAREIEVKPYEYDIRPAHFYRVIGTKTDIYVEGQKKLLMQGEIIISFVYFVHIRTGKESLWEEICVERSGEVQIGLPFAKPRLLFFNSPDYHSMFMQPNTHNGMGGDLIPANPPSYIIQGKTLLELQPKYTKINELNLLRLMAEGITPRSHAPRPTPLDTF